MQFKQLTMAKKQVSVGRREVGGGRHFYPFLIGWR